eukprot:gene20429-26510_t
MKDKVTLLVVGDDGVGKSSLISTYISNNFPVSVPQVIADSDLPGDSDNTSDKSSNRYEQKYLLSSPSSSGSFTGQIVDIWILHWHMLAMYNPSLTQNLLYRIGYVDRPNDKGVVLSKKSKISKKSTDIKLDVVKVCVLGKDGVGKRSYIWELSSLANLREQYSSNEIPQLYLTNIQNNG